MQKKDMAGQWGQNNGRPAQHSVNGLVFSCRRALGNNNWSVIGNSHAGPSTVSLKSLTYGWLAKWPIRAIGTIARGKDMAKKSLAEKWRHCLQCRHFFAADFFAFHQSVEICANLWIKLFEASTPRGLAHSSTAIFDPQIFTDFRRFLIYAVVSLWFDLHWKT